MTPSDRKKVFMSIPVHQIIRRFNMRGNEMMKSSCGGRRGEGRKRGGGVD